MSSCRLCKTPLRKAVVVATHARYDRECRRVSCAECGLVQQDPMPTQAELDYYYRSHEYRREHGEVIINWPPVGRVHSKHPRWYDALGAMGVSRCEHTMRLTGHPAAGSVLDVGCGSAYVLDAYKAAGWFCYGLEPDEEEGAKGLAKGHAVEMTTLAKYKAPVPFDLVVAHHVLEHLLDPVGALRLMRGMLAEGGQVVIEVPSVMRPYGPLSQNFFQWAHLMDYSEWTLGDAMAQAGLTCEVGPAPGTEALWAVGKPCEPGRSQKRGPVGMWMSGYLDRYRVEKGD